MEVDFRLVAFIAGGFHRAGTWLLPSAHASSVPPAEALKGLVPRRENLDDYLDLVARLLEEQASAWRSPVGAVGMMQINGRVWRTVYDLDRLSDEVDYNVNAGIEILTHYMVDYAIRRGEHEQPGGDDNLIKATYATYNGGPSHLARYRQEDTASRLRAIDNEFWRHYTTIKAEQWPDISSCYAVGN